MKVICNPIECTGCAACANSCGHNAISIIPNEYGYLYPAINQELCVNCGVCVRICPNNSLPIFNEPQNVYVGCAKDAIEQLSSTSGGIASVLCRYFVQNGGVVFGCTGKNIYDVRHIKVTSESEINLFKGSKYVQSRIYDSMLDAKRELIEGKNVLFVGTPCQIAGLKSCVPLYFQKKLITVDFVCHGVPSQQILNDALKEFHIDDIDADIVFRIKEYHSSKNTNKKIIVTHENIQTCPLDVKYNTVYGIFSLGSRKRIYSPFPKDDYIVGFLRGLFYRESCYQCHYAKIGRVSDITLGDFKFPKDSQEAIKGESGLLSKILINTAKGENVFKEILNNIDTNKIDLGNIVKEGGQLAHPMPMHPKRGIFLQEYKTYGFTVASKILQNEKKQICHHMIINHLKDVLYKLPLVKSMIKIVRR